MQKVIERAKEHITEPLFGVALFITLLTIARCFFLDIIPKIAGYDITFWLILALGFVTIYFVYVYFKRDIKEYKFLGIPALIFLIVWFLWQSQNWFNKIGSIVFRSTPMAQHNMGWDFTVLSVIAAIWLLLYAMYIYKLLRLRLAAILGIFIAAICIFSIPATLPYLTSGDMFDSHWFYGMAERTVTTGHIPDADHLVYPSFNLRDSRDSCDTIGTNYCKSGDALNKTGFYAQHIEDFPDDMLQPSEESGLHIGDARFLNLVFMGSMYNILEPLGFDLYDVAMLYGVIFGSLTIFVVYLFMRDLFAEMKPYNHIAGLLAAFLLVFTYQFASRGVGGVVEDEPIGMFLMVSTFLLFVLAFRKRSLLFAVLGGFVFLLFSLAWGPSGYVPPIIGVFMCLYAATQFIHKKSCVSHLIYFVVPILIGIILPQFILHPHNSLTIQIPALMALVPLGGAIIWSVILEIIRTYKYGVIEIKEEKIEDRIENIFHKNIYQTGAGLLVICLIMFILMGPANAFDLVYTQIAGVTKEGVVGHTIAEQADMCSGVVDCVKKIANPARLWFGGVFALMMLPLLLYLGIARRNIGALIIFSWAAPTLWKWINSSQAGFAASLPLILMASTVGLLAAANKRDLEGLRIIGTIMILIIPLVYIPLGISGLTAPGTYVIHAGEGGDIHYWMPSLQYLNENTNPEDAVITWWDYGHWIIPISNRPVLVLNIQSDQYEIQDVARFFVDKTDEAEAFKIVKNANTLYNNYNKISNKNQEIARDVGWRNDGTIGVNYALVDWTLIGKSSALHWIANGDVASPELYTYESAGGALEWCEDGDIAEDKSRLCDDPSNIYSWCDDLGKIKEWCENPDKFADKRSEAYTQCGFWAGGSDLNTKTQACSQEDAAANKCPPGVKAGYTFGTRQLVFTCGYAGPERENAIAALKFEVFETEGGYGIHKMYVIDVVEDKDGRWVAGDPYPWDTWTRTHNASILGVQSFNDILSMAINRPTDSIIQTYRTFIYVEGEWQDFMMTKLYLGTHADSYNDVGLCRASWCPKAPNHLKHFKLVEGFDNGEYDWWGYVRLWKILYDSDGDGVMDDMDECPGELETYNNYSDDDGCPDVRPAELPISDLMPGLTEGSVIFYHADYCGFCKKMEPLVTELENEGYEVYHLYNKDPQYNEKLALAQKHLGDVLDFKGGIPQFGCYANKELKVGAVFESTEELREFADKCRAAAG